MQSLWKTIVRFLKKLKTTIWYSNSIPGYIFGRNQNLKRYMHPDVHSSTVYNRQTWKQPNHSSTDEWRYRVEWVSECVCVHNEILFSYKRMKYRHCSTWMDLQIILLSEVNQTKINIIHDITYMWNLKNNTNEFIYKTETHTQT